VAFFFRFPAMIRALVILAAFSAAIAARAEVQFTQNLSPAEWKEAGFARLSTDQMTALDALIQRDVDAARQGDVVGFAKSFTERRTPDEWRRGGIDHLTPAERVKLDAIVAAAIATRPAVAFIPRPAAAGAAKEIKTAPRPWEVHGQVSMFVGAGSGGRSFYGGDFDVWATDPTHRITVGVGASEIRGKGFGYGYGCGRGPGRLGELY
jgi:hypothetical protein